MPEISIIMPVYNTQQYLNKSIHSLLHQTFSDFELILVNDGSTDYSGLYCRALAQRDNRIRLIDLPHSGIVAARIAGITAARGEYVGFVDSDDWVEEEYIQHLYSAIIGSGADVSICQRIYEYSGRSRHIRFSCGAGIYKGTEIEQWKRSWLICGEQRRLELSFGYLWDKLFRRELLADNVRYMDNRNLTKSEDELLSIACLLDSSCIVITDYADYHYRVRSGSTVRTESTEDHIKDMSLFNTMMKTVLKDKDYPELSDKVETRILYSLWGLSCQCRKEELLPLCEELKELVRRQPEDDGCERWAEAVRAAKEFYLS